jgi:hypothetical protein
MRMGESLVFLTLSVMVGWIGYRVIGPVAPIVVGSSYLVGWGLSYIFKK